MRQEARSAKIQRPPFRLGAAHEFSADRDTMATLHELGAREMPMWWRFLASFHAVPLAAIGHVLQLDAGPLLEIFHAQMSIGADAE